VTPQSGNQVSTSLGNSGLLLNRFRTEQGHCGACRRKWRLTDTDLCPCGETQTMSHVVESCPLTKLNGGLSRLHSTDKDAVSWLTNYVCDTHTRTRRLLLSLRQQLRTQPDFSDEIMRTRICPRIFYQNCGLTADRNRNDPHISQLASQ